MCCALKKHKENQVVGVQKLHLSTLETDACVRFEGFCDTAQAGRMMCSVAERCEEDDAIESTVI